MKKIGFIDYYISEWHANNYPDWFKKICEETGEEFEVKYAWAEQYLSPDGRNTDEWCRDFGVEKCETIQELCEKSDYIIILSPSNPEKHLGYAKEALKYKKNTYIDKTFAPDYKNAKEIFDIAEKYGTKIFSSSALRYGTELNDMMEAQVAITIGGGGNLPEYIVHQLEMLVKVIDEKAEKVRVDKQGKDQYIISVHFENGKKGTMIFSYYYGFSLCVERIAGQTIYKSIQSDMFHYLLTDVLRFFNTGEASFDTNQTLEIMKIREAVLKGQEEPGVWINV